VLEGYEERGGPLPVAAEHVIRKRLHDGWGQPLGGTPDEWVVIEPTYQAAQLLERLHDDPRPGRPLLGRFAFDVRHTWLRN
jgi:hypothetical protein